MVSILQMKKLRPSDTERFAQGPTVFPAGLGSERFRLCALSSKLQSLPSALCGVGFYALDCGSPGEVGQRRSFSSSR